MVNYGYCCINLTLAEQSFKFKNLQKATFLNKGLKYISELVLHNLSVVDKILHWNAENKIYIYRLSSTLFPWMSSYNLENLPNYDKITAICAELGNFAKSTSQRLTFHPGPHIVLGSLNPDLIEKSIFELEQHGKILDLLNQSRSPYAAINIHIGGAYGDKFSTLSRFLKNYQNLSDSVKSRLTIENDDKLGLYSINELINLNIPVVLDYFHHKIHSAEIDLNTALNLVINTWPKNIVPLVHYSNSKKQWEDSTVNSRAHSDLIYEQFENFGYTLDCEIEAKSKELAVLDYRIKW